MYLKNVIGYHYSKGGRHYLVIDKNRKFTRVQVFGKDIERFKARKNPGLDIFVVKESQNKNGTVYSYGGVTKRNQGTYYDYISAPRFLIKTNKVKVDLYIVESITFIKKKFHLKS